MSTKPAQTNLEPADKHRGGKHSSIRTKITFWAGLWLVLGSLILIGYSVITLRQTAIDNATKEAVTIAEVQAGLVVDVLDPPLITARALANSLGAIKDTGIPITLSRNDVNAMLRKVLLENPSFLGTYTLWEPNEFDGLDSQYVRAVAHDETGRFIPYWVRGIDGIIHTEALTQYEIPGAGDWYILPRSTKSEITIAPIVHRIQGQDVTIASFIVPIVLDGKFYGIVGVDAPIGVMQELVNNINLYDGTTDVALFTEKGTLIAVRQRPEMGNQSVDLIYPDYSQIQPKLSAPFSRLSPDGKYLQIFSPIEVDEGGTRWVMGLSIPFERIIAPATNTAIRQVAISLVFILLALIFLWFVAGQIVRPMLTLTDAAQAVSQGNLTITADVHSNDEAEVLAVAFNSMTLQLRTLFGNLEQRVADRTKALATSTEVSRRLSTILNRKELAIEVVNQVKNAFGYYHTQIYFYDEANENLVMAGGTGEAGEMMLAQFHKVAKGRGLVGRAAESNEAVLVPDTSQDSEWLPNKLLPETKSEVAIPISIGDDVLGVLNVQHNITDGLQPEDVDSMQSIANQVAIALQNIQSTEIVAKRAVELQTVAAISTTAATISDVQKMLESVVHLTQRGFGLYHAHVFVYNEDTAILKIAACGYKEGDEHEGTHGTAAIPLDQEQSLVARAARTRQAVIVNDVRSDPGWLPNPLLPDTASEMAVPMIVGDQILGVLDVQSERLNAFTEEDANIQTTLASQVATALQNARSFSQSQHQAERETALNLITQKIQNTTSVEAALQMAARELGHALGTQTGVRLNPANSHEDRKTPVEESPS